MTEHLRRSTLMYDRARELLLELEQELDRELEGVDDKFRAVELTCTCAAIASNLAIAEALHGVVYIGLGARP